MRRQTLRSFSLLGDISKRGIDRLAQEDPAIYDMLERDAAKQKNTLTMVTASSIADPSVLACVGSPTGNVTTEGYPGKRFHAGCEVVDEIENLAVERACKAFGAQYANVQPHSGSAANHIVMFSLLNPGDTILGMDLAAGGHLTHGSKASVMGNYFNAVGYQLDAQGYIDFDNVLELAKQHKPKLIICGASSYPRRIDFKRFRDIADEVGAYLLADVSHLAGLIAAGEHPSPVDHAHFTNCSTYKQLYGPRGGLILIGRDVTTKAPCGKLTLPQMIQRGAFPYVQGTPYLSAVAGKARSFAYIQSPEFKQVARRIVEGADSLAQGLKARGYRVLTGGTDNHTVLVNILERGITGVIAEKALEECNIVINKNKIPGCQLSAYVTSGMRLGTNVLAYRGMGRRELLQCADMVDRVLQNVKVISDKKYSLSEELRDEIRDEVASLCQRFPIPEHEEEGESVDFQNFPFGLHPDASNLGFNYAVCWRKSPITGAGNGRFALESIPKGAILRSTPLIDAATLTKCPPPGSCVFYRDPETFREKVELMWTGPGKIPRNWVNEYSGAPMTRNPDGQKIVANLVTPNYINHGAEGEDANVELRVDDSGETMQVVVTKDITAGEEILHDYRKYQYPSWFSDVCEDFGVQDDHKMGFEISGGTFA